MASVKINFPLTVYTPPVVNDVDFALSIYSPTLDGDNFALILYTPPALDEVDFSFGGAPPGEYYGILKRWTGSTWIKEPLKIYLGSWQTKPLKRWDSSQWREIDTTGV